ncbi:nuclear membrane organization protein Apq12p [Monosporozyma servazzii]
MSIDEQVLERDTQRYVMATLNYLVVFLQTLIPLISQFGSSHPRLFLLVTFLVLFYFTYSLLANFVKVIKRLFYIYLIVLGVAIYLRGAEQFFTSDLPLVWSQMVVNSNAFLNSNEYAFIKAQAKLLIKQARHAFD